MDIDSWSRKHHFYFFKGFLEPFFGITVEIDCTQTYAQAKETGASFFFLYLHKSLIAVNEVPNFSYRVEENAVAVYERVDPAPTVARKDGTFGFCTFPYHDDFSKFEHIGQEAFNKVKNSSSLDPSTSANVIQYSVLPWLNFTSNSHARHSPNLDSIPKITFGKLHQSSGKYLMPMSVHVNHALMDGYHVGQYVERFQELLHSS